jgi:hypothetical protein
LPSESFMSWSEKDSWMLIHARSCNNRHSFYGFGCVQRKLFLRIETAVNKEALAIFSMTLARQTPSPFTISAAILSRGIYVRRSDASSRVAGIIAVFKLN